MQFEQTTYQHYRDLPADMMNVMVPWNLEVLMTGVQRVQQYPSGLITLVYIARTNQRRLLSPRAWG
jgi:hypothetical protein